MALVADWLRNVTSAPGPASLGFGGVSTTQGSFPPISVTLINRPV